MKLSNALVAFSALTLLPAIADAGVIIDSINVKMVGMRYDVRGSDDPAATFASARTAFDDAFADADSPCDTDLAALTDASYRGTCGRGSRQNYGSLYTISGSVMGPAIFEFGLDWGRGGFIAETSGPDGSLVYLNEDIWWNKNWNHEDVTGRGSEAAASILIPQTGSFTLTLLGFEGCCDGVNAGRYQSLAYQSVSNQILPNTGEMGFDGIPVVPASGFQNQRDTGPTLFPADSRQLTEPVAGAWNDVAVNAVPLPGSLALLGTGAVLLAFGRRPRARPANA